MANVMLVKSGDWQNLESSPTPVLVDFWAEWCPPCRMMAPSFERLAETYGDAIRFAKVNVDELPELAEQYGIRSIPTLLLLREGQVLETLVGARPYDDLARILDRYVPATEKCQPRLVRTVN